MSESSGPDRCQACGSTLLEDSGECPSCALQAADLDEPTIAGGEGDSESAGPKEGDRIADRYEIIERLGEGGMGSVYRAMDHRLHAEVALKLLRYRHDRRGRERFRREQLASSGLRHRNIARVIDVNDSKFGPYLVMDLASGGSLHDRVAHLGPYGEGEFVEIALGICRAVVEAHAQGVVHRDIKPGNVLLEADGWPLLADFGLAKLMDDSGPMLSMVGQGMGTIAYAAPEQQRNATEAGPAADVFSIGATFYFALTGRSPQEREFGSVPLRWRHVVQRCMASEPEDRYPSAADLLAAVEKVAEDIKDQAFSLVEPAGGESSSGEPPSSHGSSTFHRRFQVLEDLDPEQPGRAVKARDLQNAGRVVVVKRLARPEDDASIRRFLEDPKLARQVLDLTHPNIRGILSRHMDAQGPYVVMPYLEGESLETRVQEHGPLDDELFRKVAVAIARALDAAHRKNVVHGNLRPSKVLLCVDGQVRVTDFGLVSDVAHAADEIDAYASPEERETRGAVPSHLVDIYRFGGVLHFALTGEAPADTLSPALPSTWRRILDTCLARRPEGRYFSAELVLRELEAAGGGRSQAPGSDSGAAPGVGTPVPAAAPGRSHPCPECGMENPASGVFCVRCGTRLLDRCPNPRCGRDVRAGLQYCVHCGVNVPGWRAAAEQLRQAQDLFRERRLRSALTAIQAARKQAPSWQEVGELARNIQAAMQETEVWVRKAIVAEKAKNYGAALHAWQRAASLVAGEPKVESGIQRCSEAAVVSRREDVEATFRQTLSPLDLRAALMTLKELETMPEVPGRPTVEELRAELKRVLVGDRRRLLEKGRKCLEQKRLEQLRHVLTALEDLRTPHGEVQELADGLVALERRRRRRRQGLRLLAFTVLVAALAGLFFRVLLPRWNRLAVERSLAALVGEDGQQVWVPPMLLVRDGSRMDKVRQLLAARRGAEDPASWSIPEFERLLDLARGLDVELPADWLRTTAENTLRGWLDDQVLTVADDEASWVPLCGREWPRQMVFAGLPETVALDYIPEGAAEVHVSRSFSVSTSLKRKGHLKATWKPPGFLRPVTVTQRVQLIPEENTEDLSDSEGKRWEKLIERSREVLEPASDAGD